jgi:hypothetical protein
MQPPADHSRKDVARMQGTDRVSVQSAALCRVACVHTNMLTTGCAYRSPQAFNRMCDTYAVAHKLRDRVKGLHASIH